MSDLLCIRNQYLQSNIWYNYQFVPETSKTKKNCLKEAHYKTWTVFSDVTKKWQYFLFFTQGAYVALMPQIYFLNFFLNGNIVSSSV